MSYIGTTEIGKMFLGDVEIDKAYLGNDLVFSKEASLPYTVVDYIQTDGTAYIDTGIKGNAPKSATGKMLPVAGSSYFLGCRKDSGNTRFAMLVINSAKTAGMAYYNGAWATAIDISDSVDNGTPIEFHTVLRNGTNLVGVKQQGDSSFTDYTRTVNNTVTTGRNMYVLGWNNQGTAAASASGTRCYWVKIYNSNNYTSLVFDGIPVYYNGEYGLWDLVSDSFFGNSAGSGAFTGPAIN